MAARFAQSLGASYFEVGFASTIKARSFIKVKSALSLRTRRQQDFVAVRLPGNIQRMSKNLSTEPQSTIIGVGDDVFNHPI